MGAATSAVVIPTISTAPVVTVRAVELLTVASAQPMAMAKAAYTGITTMIMRWV
jgi:hypothetical protein